MKKSFFLFLLSVLLCVPALRAQVVTTSPDPLQESSKDVVVYFHADQGSKGLNNVPASTKVYAHTGVNVVDENGKTTNWKYAPEWSVDLPKYQLEYVSENLWKLNIGDIRTYYGVAENETVKQLCFVFRNSGGSKEGKETGDQDIFVDVVESGFQLAFTTTRKGNVITSPSSIRFNATTTANADIQIFVNEELVNEAKNTTSLQTLYKFETAGDYTIKAKATSNNLTEEKSLSIVYAKPSAPAADNTIPAMGVTKNSDDTYTFCIAAPNKTTAILVGSWNEYLGLNKYVMDYVDTTLSDGTTARYFKITLPASEVGNEFGYYYCIDGTYNVGDPYARLILDPWNDKYISEEVYPNRPKYPEGLVPNNTLVAWHQDNLLDYEWNITDFKGAAKENLIIYEMLFRDFTGTEGKAYGDGTVRAAIEKIPYLKELGVNAVEILPINEFNGNNSWGYNPNFYFATDKAYGTPQDYKEFIDKCHEAGIAVILDVVFNQSDGLHPWYQLYSIDKNPFYNKTAPHAYSVLNDWRQDYPLVQKQWCDMLKYWLSEFKFDGFRFDLVKGLGDNSSYSNSGDSATSAYNKSRVDRMKALHDAMREVNPDAYFINEHLAGAKEENEMAADGELNWANVNNAGCQFAMGYSSDSNLNRMWSLKDGRTVNSTVAYLESHDEQRLGYKQTQWGVSGVKGNHKVSMQRLGGAAAQMILVPGAHMIWQFSELGNSQNTKDDNWGNDTSPKIVNWNSLGDPDNFGLFKSYCELIGIRLNNPELFAENSNYSINFSGWNNGRTASSTTDDKELYLVINPNITGELKVTVNFKSNNNDDYHFASKSFDSNPTFDAAAKTVTIPANCYAVVTTKQITGVENIEYEIADTTRIFGQQGEIHTVNCNGPVEVYSLDGSLVATAYGNVAIQVAPGTYVVRADGKTAKVRI